MNECTYTLKKLVNGEMVELALTQAEIQDIWEYFKDYLLCERAWEVFKETHDVSDSNYAVFEGVMCDIYNSTIQYKSSGYNEDDAIGAAMADHQEKINKLLEETT